MFVNVKHYLLTWDIFTASGAFILLVLRVILPFLVNAFFLMKNCYDSDSIVEINSYSKRLIYIFVITFTLYTLSPVILLCV